ncbi:MAG: hypothetical protein PHX38_07185 [Sulfuricella sp.]|nr:hypothetical protein [Sulfuricella sp.]
MTINSTLSSRLRIQFDRLRPVPAGYLLLLASYCLVVFGSPMPPRISWLETLIGGGLVLSGLLLAPRVMEEIRQQDYARRGIALAAILLLVPTTWGWLQGNVPYDMARDIFPYLFLVSVPVLLLYTVNRTRRDLQLRLISAALVFVGIFTAATFFLGASKLYGDLPHLSETMQRGFGGISEQAVPAQRIDASTEQIERVKQRKQAEAVVFLKLYDPAMMFASIFMATWGIVLIIKSWRHAVIGVALLGGGAWIASGFMLLGLRAYTALWALALVLVCATQFRRPGFYARMMPAAAIALAVMWPRITATIQMLWAKQQMVGSNGKISEWLAVLSTISASPETLLIGIGWGGIMNNPILLNEPTRFTHSMLSFFLLKTGIVGLLALLTTLAMLVLRNKRPSPVGPLTTERTILLLSCIPPLLIGVLFEPTYKMLSYGVIFALFALSLAAPKHE